MTTHEANELSEERRKEIEREGIDHEWPPL
jgi:hypothetical protein